MPAAPLVGELGDLVAGEDDLLDDVRGVVGGLGAAVLEHLGARAGREVGAGEMRLEAAQGRLRLAQVGPHLGVGRRPRARRVVGGRVAGRARLRPDARELDHVAVALLRLLADRLLGGARRQDRIGVRRLGGGLLAVPTDEQRRDRPDAEEHERGGQQAAGPAQAGEHSPQAAGGAVR